MWTNKSSFCLLLLVVTTAFGQTDSRRQEDVVLKALIDELSRSLTLGLQDLEKPYFIQYAVDDTAEYRVTAAYGAIISSDANQSRVLQSQVRVGGRELDNSNFVGRGGSAPGLNDATELPIDDNYASLRHALWLATDSQYKDAVQTLTQKRAYLKDRNIPDRPADFTPAPPTLSIKDKCTLALDRSLWEGRVKRISQRFLGYAHIQNADVTLNAGAQTRYLVNSDGGRLRDGDMLATLQISAQARADDGEQLSDHVTYFAKTPDDLPSLETVLEDVENLAKRLAAASKAPVLEDYTGPVLFDDLAAPHLFRQLLAAGLAGQADPVGLSRRNTQATDNLENRIGKRILPTTFQIYDNPAEETFQGTFLAGHYEFDDEGIPSQKVSLVVDGKLENMVMSRTPTKQFIHTNGHGRRGSSGSPRASIGCVFIESTKTETPNELKKELLDAADNEGLKYGLRITRIGRVGGGPAAASFRRGGGRGPTRSVGDPISIYKVYVSDGHEEPVRGCEFNSLDLRNLRRITAAGDKFAIHNSAGGASPASSVIAPAVLLEEVELSRIKQEAEKKPILNPPHARSEAKPIN